MSHEHEWVWHQDWYGATTCLCGAVADAVLLRDTPEDRGRLYRAIDKTRDDEDLDITSPKAVGDAIIAALRGTDGPR